MRALALLLPLVLAAPAAAQAPGKPRPRDKPDPAIADGSAQRKLDRARKRWRKAGIHNYRFTLQRQACCVGENPRILFVRDDKPV